MDDRRRSKKQEAAIAKEMGGRVQPGSGNRPLFKSDVVNTDYGFRVEAKTTAQRSYTLNITTLEKIRKEALLSGTNWMMQIDIGDKNPLRIAVLDYNVLLMLLEQVNKEEK